MKIRRHEARGEKWENSTADFLAAKLAAVIFRDNFLVLEGNWKLKSYAIWWIPSMLHNVSILRAHGDRVHTWKLPIFSAHARAKEEKFSLRLDTFSTFMLYHPTVVAAGRTHNFSPVLVQGEESGKSDKIHIFTLSAMLRYAMLLFNFEHCKGKRGNIAFSRDKLIWTGGNFHFFSIHWLETVGMNGRSKSWIFFVLVSYHCRSSTLRESRKTIVSRLFWRSQRSKERV